MNIKNKPKFTFTELRDEEFFDPLSISRFAPFTQSTEYGKWQKGLGREVRRFLIKRTDGSSDRSEQGDQIFGFFQTVKFPLLFGKSLRYIPYGPIVREISNELLNKLSDELKKYLTDIHKTDNTVFIRLDFTFADISDNGDDSHNGHSEIFRKYFKKVPISTYHSAYFQPRAEWYLDVTESEENLLKAAHEKTRYLIRLSARKGVETEIVEKDFKKYFESFYSLLCGTAARNGFSLHPKKYYENIFDQMEKNANAQKEGGAKAYLSLAKYENKILVINLIVCHGETAHFVFGGSSEEHRNISPSHAAHWAAIKHAKVLGLKNYNFGGVTINEGADNNTFKSWEGLSSFKKKFGGYQVLHSYSYDFPIKPLWYWLYVIRKVLKR